MDFAADAVMDVIAPPTRAANAKAAPADASTPSFEEHLEAATTNDAPVAPSAAPEFDDTESIECTDQPAATPLVSPQPDPSAAPVLVQLIAAAAPLVAQVTNETPIAPASTPAPAPDSATPAPLAAAPDQKSAPDSAVDAQPQAPTHAKSAPANEATPQHQAAPAQEANAAPVATPIAAPAPTPTPAPASTSQAAQAAALAGLTATPAPNTDARDSTPRLAKSDASADAALKAPAIDTKPSPPQAVAAKNTGAKNAPSGPIAKESPTFAPAADAAAPASPSLSAASTQTAPQTQHVALEQSATRAAPAAAQVAREIVRRFDGETTRFELRLDPPELGRVEVRLEVSRDHRVTATVSADSPQALTELVRHARELQQTLQSAGLELADNGLSFDLRQGSGNAQQANEDKASSFGQIGGEEASQEPNATARPLGFERWRGVRVDVMA